MAGRNISVTHEALGTTHVMKTCGMMGEVVGKASSLCVLHDWFDLRLAYQPHENRGTKVPVLIPQGTREQRTTVDMRQTPPLEHGFISLGLVTVKQDEVLAVTLMSATDGHVHADAVQLLSSPTP